MAKKGMNIYQRKDKRWEGRYKCGYTADGKAKYRSVYGKSYSAVKKALLEKKTEQEKGQAQSRENLADLADLWMRDNKTRLKESSYANYSMKLEKHILPYFAGIKYDMLTAERLNRFIEDKLSEGLSPKYVADIVVILKSIAKFCAKNYNYVNRIEYVSLPKSLKKEEKRMLNREEQFRLKKLLLSEPSHFNTGILLACATGIRIGELCGIRGADINFEKNILTIRRTVQRIKNVSRTENREKSTRIIIGTPKSISSIREIPLPDFILPHLKKLKTKEEDYLLSNEEKPVEPRVLQYRLRILLQRQNLPQINFHMLRHMFATNCVELGFDVKTISELLGHSSVEITLNRYVHSSMERKKDCMKLYSKHFSAA